MNLQWIKKTIILGTYIFTYPIKHENGQLRNVDNAVVKIASL